MKLQIAWCNVRHRPFQNAILIAITALAVALSVCILLLNNGLNKGLIAATEPFDLLVGAKGSANQLVLNTVFLQDKPIGNIPYAVVDELRKNKEVERAVPLAFGDNYNGYRIVGTENGIFEQRIDAHHPTWLNMMEGRAFEKPFEAVLGAKTAQQLHLKIGDTFTSIHGVAKSSINAHGHENTPYTVVGILKAVEGPYDQAIWTDIQSVWLAHNEEHHDRAMKATGIAPKGTAAEHTEQEEAEEHLHAAGAEREVTAILVKPVGYAEALRLYQQFQKNHEAQIVFPAQAIVQLFSLMGQGERIWHIVGTSIIVITSLLVALTMYWSGLSRQREQAVLRALGATKRDIFSLTCLENSLVVSLGAISGWLIGEGAYLAIRQAMASGTAITMSDGCYSGTLVVVGITIVVGILMGMIPAGLLYRKDIAEHL